MRHVFRVWNCRSCGRINQKLAEPNGTVVCEHCRSESRIPAGQSWGAENPATEWASVPAAVLMSSEADRRERHTRHEEEKQDALTGVKDAYAEAQKFGSPGEHHEHLEWAVGERRDTTLAFETGAIEVIALWLQDLATDLDRRRESLLTHEDGDAAFLHDERMAVAEKLRAATERFVDAFRRLP